MPEPETRSGSHSSTGLIAGTVLAMILLYPLSLGPVAWTYRWAENRGLPAREVQPVLQFIYAPLKLIYDHSSQDVRGVFDWYMGE